MIKHLCPLFALLTIFIFGCSEPQDKRSQSFGDYDKIVVVMGSENNDIRTALKSTLEKDISGLFFGGKEFLVKYEKPNVFDKHFQSHRNIVVVLDLDDDSKSSLNLRSLFASDLQKNINNDLSSTIIWIKDKFAINQDVLLISGHGQEAIIAEVKKNTELIASEFKNKRAAYLTKVLYEKGEQIELQDSIKQVLGASFRVPQGYKVAMRNGDFFWLRNDLDKFDIMNLVISKRPYEDDSQLIDSNIIAWRNEIGEKNIKGPDSHMLTDVPYFYSSINAKNASYQELRGNWKMSGNNFMGGVFVSRAIVDKQKAVQYYVEGFIYYPLQPSMKKNRHEEYQKILVSKIKQIEAVLNTFNLSKDE